MKGASATSASPCRCCYTFAQQIHASYLTNVHCLKHPSTWSTVKIVTNFKHSFLTKFKSVRVNCCSHVQEREVWTERGQHGGECERRRPKSGAVVGMSAAFGRGLVATRLPQHPREVSRLSDLVPCGSRIEFSLFPVGSANRVAVRWCFPVRAVRFHCYLNKSFTVS